MWAGKLAPSGKTLDLEIIDRRAMGATGAHVIVTSVGSWYPTWASEVHCELGTQYSGTFNSKESKAL